MYRRRLLAAVGLAAGGLTTAVGSGAFTSVAATRDVAVSVADDDDAYLALDPDDDSELLRSTVSDDTIEFSIPGAANDGPDEGPVGRGVAPNSTYTFANLLSVRNQGADPVAVFSRAPDLPAAFDRLALIGGPDSRPLDGEVNAVELASGERVQAGLLIETSAAAEPASEFVTAPLVVRADSPGESSSDSPATPPLD